SYGALEAVPGQGRGQALGVRRVVLLEDAVGDALQLEPHGVGVRVEIADPSIRAVRVLLSGHAVRVVHEVPETLAGVVGRGLGHRGAGVPGSPGRLQDLEAPAAPRLGDEVDGASLDQAGDDPPLAALGLALGDLGGASA